MSRGFLTRTRRANARLNLGGGLSVRRPPCLSQAGLGFVILSEAKELCTSVARTIAAPQDDKGEVKYSWPRIESRARILASTC